MGVNFRPELFAVDEPLTTLAATPLLEPNGTGVIQNDVSEVSHLDMKDPTFGSSCHNFDAHIFFPGRAPFNIEANPRFSAFSLRALEPSHRPPQKKTLSFRVQSHFSRLLSRCKRLNRSKLRHGALHSRRNVSAPLPASLCLFSVLGV